MPRRPTSPARRGAREETPGGLARAERPSMPSRTRARRYPHRWLERENIWTCLAPAKRILMPRNAVVCVAPVPPPMNEQFDRHEGRITTEPAFDNGDTAGETAGA